MGSARSQSAKERSITREETEPASSEADRRQEKRMEEKDAWAIAMAWAPQLQGKVRLLVDHDGPVRSIVESYAWVRLDAPLVLPDDEHDAESRRQEVVSIMRAVMVTWSALAACPGFSGAENGAFWKRVVSELQQERCSSLSGWRSSDRPEAVTDTHAFFALPDHAFPRFLVEMPDRIDPAFGKLFTLDGPRLTAGVSEKLQSLLARIRPYTIRNTSSPTINICLSRRDFFFRDVEDRGLATLVREVNAPEISRTNLPVDRLHFRICQIQIREQVSISSDDDMDAMLEFGRQIPVPIGHFQFSPRLPGGLDTLPLAERAAWIQTFLQFDRTRNQAQVTSIEFPRHYIDDAVFQALVSALPFATSLHSLAFGADCLWQEHAFEQTDLVWLAYAIFHPHAASSSWRHLNLDKLTLTPRSTYVLTAMARGNNLWALQNGTAPDCDAYFSADLSHGTLVQLEPSPGSQALYVVPTSGATVDLCGISSLDRATWSEWVAVVVPAYGLGYVRPDELRSERAHAPGKPSLTGMRLRRNLNRREGAQNDPPEALLHLLRPLGSALLYLNISFYQDVAAETLRQILGVCGSLKELVVCHAGGLWSEGAGIMPYATQLEELELNVNPTYACVATPTRGHIVTSLRRLRVLRVRIDGSRGNTLLASRPVLEQLLAHASLLEYVHWRNTYGLSLPYAARQMTSETVLAQLGLTDPKYLYAQVPTTPASAIAFISVISHASATGGSALGSLVDRGVLTTIFQFATTPVRRSIHIKPTKAD